MTGTGRSIVSAEGETYQANPPLNLRGPRLAVTGDFRVTAALSVTSTSIAYVRVYGQTPVIYDESRQERPSVRFGVSGGKFLVSIWNGTGADPVATATYGSGLTGRVTAGVTRTGSTLTFTVNGKTLGTQADRGAFASGAVIFGLECGRDNPAFYALVKRLLARGVPIDGIGFQTHKYEAADRTPVATFTDHLKKIAALGLNVRVSEMDVSGATADTDVYPPVPGRALPFDSSIKGRTAVDAMPAALR